MENDGPLLQVDRDFLIAVLQRSTDLAQLKVTLYVLEEADARGATGVPLTDLLAPEIVRSVARPDSPEPGPERVRRAVERALVDGFLLRMTVHHDGEDVPYLLPATESNRALLERVRHGHEDGVAGIHLPDEGAISIYRSNVYAAYERHIGPLTPLVAEQLRDAETSYPRLWIEDAIQIAAQANHRHWRYIQAILNRWEEQGGPSTYTF